MNVRWCLASLPVAPWGTGLAASSSVKVDPYLQQWGLFCLNHTNLFVEQTWCEDNDNSSILFGRAVAILDIEDKKYGIKIFLVGL